MIGWIRTDTGYDLVSEDGLVLAEVEWYSPSDGWTYNGKYYYYLRLAMAAANMDAGYRTC